MNFEIWFLLFCLLMLGWAIGEWMQKIGRDAMRWRRFDRTCEGGGLKVLEAAEAQQAYKDQLARDAASGPWYTP